MEVRRITRQQSCRAIVRHRLCALGCAPDKSMTSVMEPHAHKDGSRTADFSYTLTSSRRAVDLAARTVLSNIFIELHPLVFARALP